MSVLSKITGMLNQRKAGLQKSQPHLQGAALTKALLRDLGSVSWQLLAARYYLKNAQLGRLVGVHGRPRYHNEGRVIIGDNVRIWSVVNQAKLFIGPGATLRIGASTRINGAHISVSTEIDIGANVRIGPYAILMDDNIHDVQDRLAAGNKAPIRIGDNAWIAMNATILKGVTIGAGAVVAAGAVVTKDVAPYTVVAGVPARFVKQLTPPPATPQADA